MDKQTTLAAKSIKGTELLLMSKIANRAIEIAHGQGVHLTKLTMMMDLECAHAQCPLDLQRLLDAKRFDFTHDVFGILRRIKRAECELDLSDGFSPRFAL